MSIATEARNAIWSYVSQETGLIATPAAKLSHGTGANGKPTQGTGAQLGAFVSEPDYTASPNTYQPLGSDVFTRHLPTSIGQGDDGLHALNPTYRAHDFRGAEYTQGHYRQARNWQIMAFPPVFRELLQRQQAMRYKTFSNSYAPRVLSRQDYFLSYTPDPSVNAQIGGMNGLGSMGNQ